MHDTEFGFPTFLSLFLGNIAFVFLVICFSFIWLICIVDLRQLQFPFGRPNTENRHNGDTVCIIIWKFFDSKKRTINKLLTNENFVRNWFFLVGLEGGKGGLGINYHWECISLVQKHIKNSLSYVNWRACITCFDLQSDYAHKNWILTIITITEYVERKIIYFSEALNSN